MIFIVQVLKKVFFVCHELFGLGEALIRLYTNWLALKQIWFTNSEFSLLCSSSRTLCWSCKLSDLQEHKHNYHISKRMPTAWLPKKQHAGKLHTVTLKCLWAVLCDSTQSETTLQSPLTECVYMIKCVKCWTVTRAKISSHQELAVFLFVCFFIKD